MSKRIKDMLTVALRERLGEHRDILVVDNSKLDGVTANTMRNKLRKNNIRMLWIKNSLARKVLSRAGPGGARDPFSGRAFDAGIRWP